MEDGRALSAGNPLGALPTKVGGGGEHGGEPGREVEAVGWDASFAAGGPPGPGAAPLGRAQPCNSNNKRQVGSNTVNV